MDAHGLDRAEALIESSANEAIDIAMLAIAEGRELARAFAIAAEAHDSLDMAPEALNYWDMSLVAAPTARAYAGRGLRRHARNESDAALADFDRALELDPNCGLAHYGRGLIFDDNGDDAGAIRELTQATEQDGGCRGRALFRRAVVHFAARRKRQGQGDLLAAAEVGHREAAGQLAASGADTSKWSAAALQALAAYHRDDGEPERQVEALTLALDKLEGKTKHDVVMEIGYIQCAEEDFAAAVKSFRVAAELMPEGPGLANVARTYYCAGKYRQAEATAREVFASAAEPFDAHLTLGYVHAEAERHRDALEAYDRALAMATPAQLGEIQLQRARTLLELGRRDEARKALLAAEDAGDDEARAERLIDFPAETAADFIGDARYQMGRGALDAAREAFERGVALYRKAMRAPGDLEARQLSEALVGLGHVLHQVGDVDEALRVLDEACKVHPAGFEPPAMLGYVVWDADVNADEALTVDGEALVGVVARQTKALAILDRAVALAHGATAAHYGRGRARFAAGRGIDAAADFEVALTISDWKAELDAASYLVKSLWKAAGFEEARSRCRTLYADEDDIEDGKILIARFRRALDGIVRLRSSAKKTKAGAFPFRFYGARPGESRLDGSYTDHAYRLRFLEVPDASVRTRIAAAVSARWSHIDDGHAFECLWSGPFVQVSFRKQSSSDLDDFFSEVVVMMKRIHDVAPIEEVVSLNAQALTKGDPESEGWERWSLAVAALPTPHPFENDGELFFSAFGADEWPKPASDEGFDAAREAETRKARGATKKKAPKKAGRSSS